MNYKKTYYALVDKRFKNRLVKGKDICESHHIYPKSLGGKDTSDNIVNFTPEEHFVAHMLLEKWFFNEYGVSDWRYKAVSQALFFMTHNKKYPDMVLTPKTYSNLRTRYVLSISGENNKSFGKTGKLSKNYGKKQSEEAKRKNSESHKGRVHMHHPESDVEVVVYPSEIAKYAEIGFVFGISEHSHKGFSAARSNCKHMFHPKTQQQVFAQPKDIQKYLDQGFVFGVNEKNAHIRSQNNINRISMHDPISGIELHIKPEDFDAAILAGLLSGRGSAKSSKTERKVLKDRIAEFKKGVQVA